MPFIVLEGLDGSGKSTLASKLESFLTSQGQQCFITSEPYGPKEEDAPDPVFFKNLSQILLHHNIEDLSELMIYGAIRTQHTKAFIEPALKANKWVISDRYFASSIAFQSGGRGLDRKTVDQVNAFATGGLKPDVTFLLDISCQSSKERRGEPTDRIEAEAQDFHERVRKSYLDQSKDDPTWVVLDSLQPAEALEKKAIDFLTQKFKGLS